MRWKVTHMTRQSDVIGRWRPQWAHIWAADQREALEKHRKMLLDAGWEAAGGRATEDPENED